MESIVNLIETVKNNIKELEESKKKNEKEIAALQQEQDDITKNLVMFRKVLNDLNRTKNDEIQMEMELEKEDWKIEELETPDPVVLNETHKLLHKKGTTYGGRGIPIKIIAIDEKDDIIAKYDTAVEAGKDLGLNHTTVSYRLKNMSVEKQIEKYGYALKRA